MYKVSFKVFHTCVRPNLFLLLLGYYEFTISFYCHQILNFFQPLSHVFTTPLFKPIHQFGSWGSHMLWESRLYTPKTRYPFSWWAHLPRILPRLLCQQYAQFLNHKYIIVSPAICVIFSWMSQNNFNVSH